MRPWNQLVIHTHALTCSLNAFFTVAVNRHSSPITTFQLRGGNVTPTKCYFSLILDGRSSSLSDDSTNRSVNEIAWRILEVDVAFDTLSSSSLCDSNIPFSYVTNLYLFVNRTHNLWLTSIVLFILYNTIDYYCINVMLYKSIHIYIYVQQKTSSQQTTTQQQQLIEHKLDYVYFLELISKYISFDFTTYTPYNTQLHTWNLNEYCCEIFLFMSWIVLRILLTNA